jgi:putative ABC transport system permease protein
MSLIKRSLLNLLRSPARTIVVIVMLAISLGLGLTIFEANSTLANQLGAISGEIGNDITVNPAGYEEGMPNSNLILAQSDIAKLNDLAHVVSVQPSLQVAYSGSSSITPGNPNGATRIQALSVMGFDLAIADPTTRNNQKITVVKGTYFTAKDTNADVAVVGQALAEANNLGIGSTIDVTGTSVRVIGIYNSGPQTADNLIIMPIAVVQSLYGLPGANEVIVAADNVSNVDPVVQEIRTVFDAKTADVLTATEEYNKINPNISGATGASWTSMIVAFGVAALIILLSVFLVMRQRVREIGIMKALGASNWRIGFGFGIETLFICLVSAGVGVGMSLSFFRANAGGVRMNNYSPGLLLLAIGVTIALALISSIVPVWYIARVRPAEVLRNE